MLQIYAPRKQQQKHVSPPLNPKAEKTKSWKHSQVPFRGVKTCFFEQLNVRKPTGLEVVLSPAGFLQISGSTLQVQTQLWAMQERLLPFVGAIPASRYVGMSRALTVICAFPPCLSLLPSMSCLLNLLHNKYFHFFPWRVKWAHRKICLSPCITTKSAHQAQIRVYFLLPSDRWWCVKETGVNPQGSESISRMF